MSTTFPPMTVGALLDQQKPGWRPPFAVRVDVDGTMEEWLDKPTLEDYQRGVGGWIEAVGLVIATGYINEEGKIQGLLPNRLATALYHSADGPGSDYIAGPMVIVGPPDGEGEDTPIPESMLLRLRTVRP